MVNCSEHVFLGVRGEPPGKMLERFALIRVLISGFDAMIETIETWNCSLHCAVSFTSATALKLETFDGIC